MPKVSIIIPVHNVDKYLNKCLDSIVNQTLKDIEIICIEDGSTDNSAQILEEYSKKDSRIIILKQDKKGANVSRTNALKIVTGEYIGFVDSDDWIDLNYYEELYNKAKKESADIVRTTYKYCYSNDQVDGENNYLITQKSLRGKELNKNEHSVVIWNAIYKLSFLRENKIDYFDEDLPMHHDIPFTARTDLFSKKTVAQHGVYYYYRKNRDGQLISPSLKRLHCSIIANNKVLELINKIHLEKEDYLKAFLRCVWRFNNNFNLYLNQSYFIKEEQISYLKQYKNFINQFKYLSNMIPLYETDLGTYLLEKNKFEDYIKYCKKENITEFNKLKLFYLFSIGKTKEKYKKLYSLVIKYQAKLKTKKIIASLTSYPDRITTVHHTIKSLLEQSIKPDKLILWLAPEQFPQKEKNLPKDLLDLKKEGLTIDWYQDIKSYKKLIPTLKKYPNDIIITFDDDIIYDKNYIETLYENHLLYPNCIICNRAHYITFKNKTIDNYENWHKACDFNKPSYNILQTGVGGVLYPARCLDKNVFNEKDFTTISKNTDDLWFWAMAVLKNTKIKVTKKSKDALNYIENSQVTGLYIDNCTNGNNDKNLKLIFEKYPQILEKLNKESLENICKLEHSSYFKLLNSNLDKTNKQPVVLWGASLFLEDYLNENDLNNYNVIGIIDKNIKLHGNKINNLQVFSPEKIEQLCPKYIILTIKNNNQKIYQELKDYIKVENIKTKLMPNIFD